MLDPDYLQEVPKELEEYFYELETTILADIAERISLNRDALTATANYQLSQLNALGVSEDKINEYLSEALKIGKEKASKIITDSAYKALEDDNLIFKEAFEKGMIASFSYDKQNFKNLIVEGINALSGELSNICNTTVITAQKTLINTLNKAYLQVSSGAFTMDQAVDMAINQLANDGLGVIEYKSGIKRRLNTAVRTAVRSAVNQTACKCQELNMDELGCNLVETTSHLGARPQHAEWQGKVYWRNHPYKNYKNFKEATRYGYGDGLGGWNCRHSFYPFFPGISEKTFEHYKSKENNELYELQQQQRYNETKIREWKRKRDIKKAIGLDIRKESEKVRYWSHKNDFLIKSDDRLKRNYSREKVHLSKKNGIIDISDIKVSGALDPDSKKASKHAEQYYESVRKMKTDYKKIALNTGFDTKEIMRIKNYLFIEEHELLTGKKRFDPDYMIAESWRRLVEGKSIQHHDLTMLNHEILEHKLVLSGIPQDKAHKLATEKYNYNKEAIEYHAKVNKRKKK